MMNYKPPKQSRVIYGLLIDSVEVKTTMSQYDCSAYLTTHTILHRINRMTMSPFNDNDYNRNDMWKGKAKKERPSIMDAFAWRNRISTYMVFAYM